VLLLHPELDWSVKTDLAASQDTLAEDVRHRLARIHLLAPPRNFRSETGLESEAHQARVSEGYARLQTDGHAHPIILVEEAGEIGLGVPMHDFCPPGLSRASGSRFSWKN